MNDKIKLTTPLSHGLPKTGQIVSYHDNDDGALELGWWLKTFNVNNRVRFVEKEYVAGEVIILDLATGLMWPKSGLSSICGTGQITSWINAFVVPTVNTFSGFSDWRLPNLQELLSICNHSFINPAIHTEFTDVQADNYKGYWTSTTYASDTSFAWYVRFVDGYAFALAKTSNTYYRPCRCLK